MKATPAFACAAGLMFGAAAAADPAPAFRPLSYDVSLTPDFASGVISGVERLRFQSLSDNLDAVSFTANSLAVKADLNGKTGVTISDEGARIFHLPRHLAKGETATLTISFVGRPKRDVVFTRDEIHTGYFTCEVMICDIDRPGDRATLMFALTLPPGFDAAAPGDLISRTPSGAGLETWQWREDRPYPAYLYGFAAGRYARATLGRNPPLSVLYAGETAAQVQAAFADTAQMVAFYESKAGMPLPERQYAQVLVDQNGNQEDASLSMIEKASIEPAANDPHPDGMIAHELAHQWWGNLLTCSDWKELWLNEGMAGFMAAAWKEHRWGRAAYDAEMAAAQRAWDNAKKSGMDEPLSWTGTYPTLRDKRRIAYGKSMVFLDTLRSQLGEEVFWRGVRNYTQTNAGRSVTAADMEKAFEASSGRDLSGIFKTWVFGDGVLAGGGPALTLTHLAGALYLAEDDHYTKTNSLVYVGPSSVTVIGATWTPDTAAILAHEIEGVTAEPIRDVIDTSPDPEWSGGNAYWQSIGAHVIAANVTCSFLKANWNTTVAGIQKSFAAYPTVPLSAPTDCKPDRFDLQDGRIQVLYLGPSHTDADVFVYFPDEKVLDAGSIIKEQLGNLAKANITEYPNTLRKLQDLHLNIETVIAGHWSAVHGPELIDKYLSLLSRKHQSSPAH